MLEVELEVELQTDDNASSVITVFSFSILLQYSPSGHRIDELVSLPCDRVALVNHIYFSAASPALLVMPKLMPWNYLIFVSHKLSNSVNLWLLIITLKSSEGRSSSDYLYIEGSSQY